MKTSITKIILLSIALLLTPVLNYSMAYTVSQTNHSAVQKQLKKSASSYYHAKSDKHVVCSTINNSTGSSHQTDEQCDISCCGSLIFLTTTVSLLTSLFLHPAYYNNIPPLAASINLDMQLPPPRSVELHI